MINVGRSVNEMGKLAERLKKARNGLHLSQEFVSKQLNINRASVVQIEAGKRRVSAEELSQFSKLYGYSVDELLYGNRPEMPRTMFARGFSELDETDQNEILSLIEFKKMMKATKH
jgi:transcriptional regulator with XRE-family HTH domain